MTSIKRTRFLESETGHTCEDSDSEDSDCSHREKKKKKKTRCDAEHDELKLEATSDNDVPVPPVNVLVYTQHDGRLHDPRGVNVPSDIGGQSRDDGENVSSSAIACSGLCC